MMTEHAIADRHLHRPAVILNVAEREILEFLLPLSPDYPGIKDWFVGNVVPGLRRRSRTVVRIDRGGRIVALGIAKAEDGEAKICTVRIAPDFVGRGLGIRVFDELMNWLGTDQPLATVSEVRLDDFSRIFNYYKFRLTSIRNGLYVPGRAEYLFNEPLSPWGQQAPTR